MPECVLGDDRRQVAGVLQYRLVEHHVGRGTLSVARDQRNPVSSEAQPEALPPRFLGATLHLTFFWI
jgi:hypothetical protein